MIGFGCTGFGILLFFVSGFFRVIINGLAVFPVILAHKKKGESESKDFS